MNPPTRFESILITHLFFTVGLFFSTYFHSSLLCVWLSPPSPGSFLLSLSLALSLLFLFLFSCSVLATALSSDPSIQWSGDPETLRLELATIQTSHTAFCVIFMGIHQLHWLSFSLLLSSATISSLINCQSDINNENSSRHSSVGITYGPSPSTVNWQSKCNAYVRHPAHSKASVGGFDNRLLPGDKCCRSF